jgi:hypothetical protein
LSTARPPLFAVLALGLGLAFTTAVLSQTARDESVTKRPRPDFAPLGLELDNTMALVGLVDDKSAEANDSALSSFIVFPRLETEARYESNLFRTENNKRDDLIIAVLPSLEIKSDWNNHALSLRLGGEIARHVDNASDDYEDAFAEIKGRIDVSDEIVTDWSLAFDRRHVPRDDPDDPGAEVAPIIYYAATARAGITYRPEPFLLSLAVEADNLDFKDSGAFDADERDRAEYRARARIGYEALPGTVLFVEPSVNLRAFDRRRDNAGFEQDNSGYQILVGGTWSVSAVTFAEFGIGYLSQSYDERRFDRVEGPGFSGKLIWNPTALVTVTAQAGRSIAETTQPGIAGILQSRYAARLDYAPVENLTFSWSASLQSDAYQGSNRDDDTVETAIGAEYLFNRNWFARARLGYTSSRSSALGEDFTNYTISLRIGMQL